MDLFSIITVLILILFASYWFFTRTYNYWDKQNVPIISNPIPVFGNVLSIITLKETLFTFATNACKKTKASAIGFYFLQQPALVVRDPELIKNILQTNFNSFHINGIHINKKADPVISEHPFFVADLTSWRTARARTVSHLSGKKLQILHYIIQEVCSQMNDYVNRKIEINGGSFECELKDHFTRYTGELVANAAFGVQGQSFNDNPDKLAFTNVAKTLFAPTLWNGIKGAVLFYLPTIADFIGISFLDKKTDNYFRETLKAIIKQRKEANIFPNDYLQFCIESNGEDNIDQIIADVIVFYGDVFETSSTSLASVFYNLSQNKEVQDKLRKHIVSTIEKTDGVITYESLKNMTYLDQVISESLRLLPPVGALLKVCTEEITLTGSDGLNYHLQPGNYALLPTWELQHNSEHWTDPEKFDPDRFSAENVAGRHKFVYIPFGEGPRMCVGMRLAYMLIKTATASLLLKYSIEKSPKTAMPFEFDTISTLMVYIKGGLWGTFKKLK